MKLDLSKKKFFPGSNLLPWPGAPVEPRRASGEGTLSVLCALSPALSVSHTLSSISLFYMLSRLRSFLKTSKTQVLPLPSPQHQLLYAQHRTRQFFLRLLLISAYCFL